MLKIAAFLNALKFIFSLKTTLKSSLTTIALFSLSLGNRYFNDYELFVANETWGALRGPSEINN